MSTSDSPRNDETSFTPISNQGPSAGESEMSRTAPPLEIAIKNGDMPLCKKLLDQGASLNDKFGHCSVGCTPLLFALQYKQTDIATLFLDRGAKIEGSTCKDWDTRGYDPVHHAVAFGPCSLLRKLLDQAPNYRTVQPVQPIHIAAAVGCVECINLLIDHDERSRQQTLPTKLKDRAKSSPKFSITTIPEDCALQLVGDKSSLAIPEALPTAAMNIPVDRRNLKWDWRLTDSVQIKTSPNDVSSATALHIASLLSNERAISTLLRRGAAVNVADQDGYTALNCAACNDNSTVVASLLLAGTNPNIPANDGRMPISVAAENGHLRIVELLIESGVNVEMRDGEGRTVLHFAARGGQFEVMSLLLARGGRVNTASKRGKSALHYALTSETDTMDDWVVSYTTSFKQWSTREGTILTELCLRNRVRALKNIFQSPRAGEARDSLDMSSSEVGPALVETAIRGLSGVVEVLLDAGANMETSWGDHGTALMAACSHGRLPVVQILLSRGAKASYANADGRCFSAVDQAKPYPEIVNWLKDNLWDQGSLDLIGLDQDLKIQLDRSNIQPSENLLRRRNSSSMVHEDWELFKHNDAHRKDDKSNFEDLVWKPTSLTEMSVHEPRWARGHRLSKFVFRASNSRASGAAPCDAWMIF
jgi:ankyrin repeat protein